MTKSGKHCGKRRNCTFCAISSFVTMFSKSRLLHRRQKASIWGKGLRRCNRLILNMFSFYNENVRFKIMFYSNNLRPPEHYTKHYIMTTRTFIPWGEKVHRFFVSYVCPLFFISSVKAVRPTRRTGFDLYSRCILVSFRPSSSLLGWTIICYHIPRV